MISNGKLLYCLPNNIDAFQSYVPTPIGHSVPYRKQKTLGAREMCIRDRCAAAGSRCRNDRTRGAGRGSCSGSVSYTHLDVYKRQDVYTTGSTMEAAASCLKAAGAEKVYCITLCTGQG